MSDDLVERVAKIYQNAWGVKDLWRAKEVIALVRNEALEVQRECKTDRWTVEQYPVATCPPQGNVYLRGGSYGQ